MEMCYTERFGASKFPNCGSLYIYRLEVDDDEKHRVVCLLLVEHCTAFRTEFGVGL